MNMLAKWWEVKNGKIHCLLCPNMCLIQENSLGKCGIRKNINGKLYSLGYARPVALQIDPIEKKPLNNFLQGTKTFSLGTNGCNLSCKFCQNHHISQVQYTQNSLKTNYKAEEIVKLSIKNKCSSISFTYNEPIIWGEYLIEIAQIAKKNYLSTVLVSNAYVNKQAAEEIFQYIDAANFDMKGFSEDFYSEMTGGHLLPVLEAIKYFYSLGKHLELTNLIIPGKNDSINMIENYLDWVASELDKSITLHFSAFHPDYKYFQSPATPNATLFSIKKLAEKKGFTNIYLGNIINL
jgi:pyruvate formate lyase activating enzyme